MPDAAPAGDVTTGPGLWAEQLAPLVPELAAALLPLLRGVDDLVHRRDAGSAEHGVLDGYDGLVTRGHPDQLLMSEWLLADEIPLEFLRRAAEGELLHLARSYQQPQPRGRVVVLVDAGPEQLGVARLVQLAALLVLHRRGAAVSAGMAVGILGDAPGRWLEGDLAQVLLAWREDRRRALPTAADVAAHDPGQETWVLCGPTLAAALGNRRRVLTATEGRWDQDGVRTACVVLDGDAVELTVPPTPLAVRALRGAAFRVMPAPVHDAQGQQLSHPTFPSPESRLLMRGSRANVLFATYVNRPPGHTSKLKEHILPGEVLAASFITRRLVALVQDADVLRIQVIGKAISDFSAYEIPVSALDEEVLREARAGLPELHLFGGGVLALVVAGRTFRLLPRGVAELDALAFAPGASPEKSVLISVTPAGITLHGRTPMAPRGVVAAVAAPPDRCALGTATGTWTIHRGQQQIAQVEVPDDEVLGLVGGLAEPALLTRTRSGLILRLVSATGTRTLTRWSGRDGRPALHPTLPLMAVHGSGLIEVVDIDTNQLVLALRTGAP